VPAVTSKPRTIGALGSGWLAHTEDYPLALSWSCDGSALFTIDAAGRLYCFDGRSGVLRWSRDAHKDGAITVACSPTAAVLVSAGKDGCVRLWDTHNGKTLATLEFDASWVEHLAWSPDGQHFAAAGGRLATIWSEDAQRRTQCTEHGSTVSALAWSTASELVTACYGQVSCWQANSGALSDRFTWAGSLISLALSADGAIIACGSQDASVHFWRRASRADSEIRGYRRKPSVIAFDRNSEWLASNGDDFVTLWNFTGDGPEDSQPLILDRHSDTVTCLEFARRYDLLASGARDGSVCLWSLGSRRAGHLVGGSVLGAAVVKLAWRPDQRALAGLDASGAVNCWRVRPEQALTTRLNDDGRGVGGDD
jgi:WD40 repeat protein